MRKPAATYRGFRLHKLNAPQFRHLKLLYSWVGFFAFFFLTENAIPPERCYSVHMFLDDWIPFCEWFLIPYAFWYVLIVFSLIYFLLYDIPRFKALQTYIIITQVIAMAAYILFPTKQELRPEVFPRDNFLTHCVAVLYRIDTNTGVCPSLHVAYALGIASVWLKKKDAHILWRGFVLISVVLICLSTVFIKQHSAVDFFAALPMCLMAEFLVFKKRPCR